VESREKDTAIQSIHAAAESCQRIHDVLAVQELIDPCTSIGIVLSCGICWHDFISLLYCDVLRTAGDQIGDQIGAPR
jgi:hypothetical protein